MATRVYVGRLPYRASERDVEKFFRGYGKVTEVILKNGFAFVDFEKLHDAEDASHKLNGKDLMGSNLIVEIAKGTPRGRDRYGWNPPPSKGRSSRHSHSSSSSRRYRVIVENLSSRVDERDLKDLFRKCGDIVKVEAHGRRKNEGYVEFSHRDDAEQAVEKFDGYEMEGRKLKVSEENRHKSGSPVGRKSGDEKEDSKERSRSRSRGRHSDVDQKSEGSKDADD